MILRDLYLETLRRCAPEVLVRRVLRDDMPRDVVAIPAGYRRYLTRENARLIAAGLTIGEINAARRRMSAIKGGKLARRVRGRCVTLVYSDVASGPTIPGSDEVHLIADNRTLVATAATLRGCPKGG